MLTKYLKPKEARELIFQLAGSSIFGVKFNKRTNGEDRQMQCRLHVRKGVLGTGSSKRWQEDIRCNLITVFDMNKRTERGQGAFRRINLERVEWVRIKGMEIRVTVD